MSRVGIVGTGYVGLTTGAFLASLGHQVCCADVDPEKVAALSRGEIPITEEGLEAMVGEGLSDGRLSFILGAAGAAARAEFVFLCVPTPQGPEGAADMSYVVRAATEIGPVLEPGAIVITKSTVPVGSTGLVQEALGRDDVAVVSNPEFLREGSALHDCLHPDRIVIGSTERAVAMRALTLYDSVHAPVVITDPVSAEMIKYASNAFLATKVSYVNAIANLCEAVGANASDVLAGIGHDHRIGGSFLRQGPGWGGSCLPKDTRALLCIGEAAGYNFDLLRAVIEVNEQQHIRVVSKVAAMAGGSLTGVTLAAWGLTFKAGTDDCRESPAIKVIKRLVEAGAAVRAYDPTVRGILPGMEVFPDPYAAAEGAVVLVILTEWDEFRWLDFDKVANCMTSRRVVDARNLLDPIAMRKMGFSYDGIGSR